MGNVKVEKWVTGWNHAILPNGKNVKKKENS